MDLLKTETEFMNPLEIIIAAGYLMVMTGMITLSARLLSSEKVSMGWRTVFIFLTGISAFLALISLVWLASNIENWSKQW